MHEGLPETEKSRRLTRDLPPGFFSSFVLQVQHAVFVLKQSTPLSVSMIAGEAAVVKQKLPVLRIGFFSFRRALSYTIIYKNIDNRAEEYRRKRRLTSGMILNIMRKNQKANLGI